MRMQVGRIVAVVAVVGAVVSGCGGATQAGTAVFVGENAVPLEHIQTQLDAALAKEEQIAQLMSQGGTTADLARSIVTRAVMHDLLILRASEEGITITMRRSTPGSRRTAGPMRSSTARCTTCRCCGSACATT